MGTLINHHSPCNGGCRWREDHCTSCLRTLEEIRLWLYISDEEKKEIMERIQKEKTENGS